jgi:hypothetical protein
MLGTVPFTLSSMKSATKKNKCDITRAKKFRQQKFAGLI